MAIISLLRGDHSFLSNFWSHNGPAVEYEYQAAKAKYYDDYIKIMSAESAGEAKKLSKTIIIREDWDSIKLVVMEMLLRKKFASEPLKSKLISTGNAFIIEGNDWGDTYWGVCGGKGDNHLGRLLMKIRDEFLVSENIRQY